MQFSILLLASAAFAIETTVTSTATVTPSAEVVSLYTDAAGKTQLTTLTTLKYSKAAQEYSSVTGEVITTIGPSHAATTVTTTTGTHKYGRFDKTKPEEEPSSTGTHKYGRFDKTKAEEEPSSTGTHKYGRFDKTDAGTQTAVLKDASSANEAGRVSYGYGAAALVAALLAC